MQGQGSQSLLIGILSAINIKNGLKIAVLMINEGLVTKLQS